MKLVIAEKPGVAQSIAQVLGSSGRRGTLLPTSRRQSARCARTPTARRAASGRSISGLTLLYNESAHAVNQAHF